jgi:hypothetical protein
MRFSLRMRISVYFAISDRSSRQWHKALVTGIVQSIGTPGGLFRHHWVVANLELTVIATIILLVDTRPIGRVAAFASTRTLSGSDLRQVRIQLIARDIGAACDRIESRRVPDCPIRIGRRARSSDRGGATDVGSVRLALRDASRQRREHACLSSQRHEFAAPRTDARKLRPRSQ